MSVPKNADALPPDNKMITSKEPIRLFRSDFMEFFSHTSPVMVVILWVPVSLLLAGRGIYLNIVGAGVLWQLPLLIFSGWFIWTFVEYMVHRFIFHYHPRTERLKRIFFTAHGVHHAQPMCKTRLVMPPILSIPLALFFYGMFYLVIITVLNKPLWMDMAFAGFTTGYLIYDLIHYSLHHSKIKKGYLANCRRQHMRHHVTCPSMRFGVSFPLWDFVFGTMPASGFRRKPTATQ